MEVQIPLIHLHKSSIPFRHVFNHVLFLVEEIPQKQREWK